MKLIVSISFVILFWIAAIARADLVISEIMANEPSNRVLLEWIEIYNNGTRQECPANYRFVINDDTLHLPEMEYLASHRYMVLCRRLIADSDSSDSFENYWGNASGVWGDDASEHYLAAQLNLSLSNSSGFVMLLDSLNRIVDECHWQSACNDGFSYERNNVNDAFSDWHCCTDSAGATPGAENSTVNDSEDFTFMLGDNHAAYTRGGFHIEYWVPFGTKTSLLVYDDTGRRRAVVFRDYDYFYNRTGWNGKDDEGNFMRPGLYFLKFEMSGAINKTKLYPVVITP